MSIGLMPERPENSPKFGRVTVGWFALEDIGAAVLLPPDPNGLRGGNPPRHLATPKPAQSPISMQDTASRVQAAYRLIREAAPAAGRFLSTQANAPEMHRTNSREGKPVAQTTHQYNAASL